MELPIQLKFFRKLELYQELKFQDRKSKASERFKKVWKTEKLILGWTARGHHLIACPINHDYVRNGDGLLRNKNSNDYDLGLSGAFTNLIGRGFAVPVKDNETQILFTPVGLLMGEVMNDVESGMIGVLKYELFFYLTWLTAVAGAAIIIINLVEKIVAFF